jgi:Tfp pilus assembly protein PilZ
MPSSAHVSGMGEEARKHRRRPVWLPIGIDGEGRPNRIGVSRDASMSGVLISTGSRFKVGESVTLRIRLSGTGGEIHAKGRVVRVDQETGPAAHSWPFRIAVNLEEPVSALQEVIEDVDLDEVVIEDADIDE